MARITLNSANTAVVIGDSPSFKTTDETGYIFAGVQNASFSVPLNRQTQKQVGSCYYSVDDLVRHPDVDLSIDYLFSPTLANENLLGLNVYNGDGVLSDSSGSFISGLEDQSYNFYFYNHPDQNFDAIEYITSNDVNSPNDGELISFGNAYLTEYGLSFANRSLPVVSTKFKCCNVEGELYTGDISSPSINLMSGNNIGVGNLNFSGTKSESNFDVDLTSPILSRPGDLTIELENLQVGGQTIAGADHMMQSMSIQLPVSRVDLHGLGSDYIRDRKMQYPLRGNLSIASLVSGYQTGFISGLLRNEQTYNFDITAGSCEGEVYSVFDFNDLKLETFDYSMAVNDRMQYSASFSFAMDNKSGIPPRGLLASFYGVYKVYTSVFDAQGDLVDISPKVNPLEGDILDDYYLNNTNIYSVEIGRSCTEIGEDSFRGCSNLGGNLYIPNNVTEFGVRAFQDCNSLNGKLTLDLVGAIGSNAFDGCSNITSLELGENISIINEDSFLGCGGITTFRSRAITPPSTTASSLDGIPTQNLYVPKGYSNDYNSAPWGRFTKVEDPA